MGYQSLLKERFLKNFGEEISEENQNKKTAEGANSLELGIHWELVK